MAEVTIGMTSLQLVRLDNSQNGFRFLKMRLPQKGSFNFSSNPTDDPAFFGSN